MNIDSELNRETLLAALKSLLYTSGRRRPVSLIHLRQVRLRAHAPYAPTTDKARLFALQSLLIDTIGEQYRHHRRLLGLSHPPETASAEEALEHISEDGRLHHVELMAWSWLYHRYARYDLALEAGQFVKAALVEEKTHRRYAEHGLRRLEEILFAQEMRLSMRYNKLLQLEQLPGRSIPLVGHEDTKSRLEGWMSLPARQPLLVTGPSGIGKTAVLIDQFTTWINAERLRGLIWLTQPLSSDFVFQSLAQTAATRDVTEIDLYAATHHLALVIDGIDCLFLEELQALAQRLPNLLLLMTSVEVSKESAPEWNVFPMRLLTSEESTQLVHTYEQVLMIEGETFTDSEQQLFVREGAGYPGRIMALMRQFAAG